MGPESGTLYIAYGSNLHPKRLLRRASSVRVVGAFELPGWRLAWHKRGSDGSGKCDLVRVADPLECAHVVLYDIPSVADRRRLDEIEGVGHGYEVEWMDVPSLGRAFVYRATAAHIDPSLRPYSWYRDLTLEGARHHGLPATWIDQIERVETWDDPDPAREQEHRDILKGHQDP